jgi:methionyl-tRNA formyltransferase
MKLVFAGTPEFARVALQALHEAGHEIAWVLTQPDRPAGRGMRLQPSAVKAFALTHDMAVAQPRSLRLDGKYPEEAAQTRDLLVQCQPDAMIVAAYGLILPQWVLDLPTWGCLNIHASVLPRWRGAAPIHRAIEAGDAITGVTLMQMDAGLDTGAMLMTQTTAIGPDETTGQLHDRLAEMGGNMMVRLLPQLGQARAQAQPDHGATYAHKIEKAESWLNWQQPALTLARKLRAFDPFPGGSAQLDGMPLKIWAGHALPLQATIQSQTAPGTILVANDAGIDVMTGEGVLRLTQLQRPGGKRLGCADFLRGHPLAAGAMFEAQV